MYFSHQGKDADVAHNIAYSVLRQRHLQEAVNLEEQLQRERDAQIAQKRALVAAERAIGRETLQTTYETVCLIHPLIFISWQQL